MMRRWMVGALVLLLALSVIGWIFYMPPSALNMLKPVPAHARIVYQSDTPGWFLSFFPTLGTCRRQANPWEKSFQTLEKSPLAVASVALGGRGRRDTWVAVSAVGRRAVFLRWQLVFAPPEGVKPSRPYGAWPVWQYSDPSLPAWMCIRFSVAEGLLICSISDDSHDIYDLLDTLDGRRPSADRKEK
ncbi:MAG: hypothetical protein WC047_05455 [Kiritimatiellales bacterium]